MNQVYWVVPGILGGRCGPARAPWDPLALRAAGVHGVISLDEDGVQEDELRRAGIEHLPLYQPMIFLAEESQRRQFLSLMPDVFRFLEQLQQRKGAAIVHCYHGCDRTGTVLACCLMIREGLTAEQAIQRVLELQPLALKALGYVETVQLFETLR